MHMVGYFSGYSTLKFNGEQSTTLVEQNPNYWKADEIDENNTPPWCRAKSFYYHWATDEPKNFKAVGKGYNLVTEKHRSEMSDSFSCESKLSDVWDENFGAKIL